MTYCSWARSDAQRAVTKRLKVPSTADFPDCGWSIGRYRIAVSKDHSTASVQGYVDAQNSFGAKLRGNWEVKLRRRDDGDHKMPRWDAVRSRWTSERTWMNCSTFWR